MLVVGGGGWWCCFNMPRIIMVTLVLLLSWVQGRGRVMVAGLPCLSLVTMTGACLICTAMWVSVFVDVCKMYVQPCGWACLWTYVQTSYTHSLCSYGVHKVIEYVCARARVCVCVRACAVIACMTGVKASSLHQRVSLALRLQRRIVAKKLTTILMTTIFQAHNCAHLAACSATVSSPPWSRNAPPGWVGCRHTPPTRVR